MDEQDSFWLDDDFNASQATKLQLRRWISRYGIPVPSVDVKKDKLLSIWEKEVAPNRARLRAEYHDARPDPNSNDFSPIGNVTPARVQDVEVPKSADSAYSRAANMFRRAHTTPTTPSRTLDDTVQSRKTAEKTRPSATASPSAAPKFFDQGNESDDDDVDIQVPVTGLGVRGRSIKASRVFIAQKKASAQRRKHSTSSEARSAGSEGSSKKITSRDSSVSSRGTTNEHSRSRSRKSHKINPPPMQPFLGTPKFELQEGFFYDKEQELQHIEKLLHGVQFRKSTFSSDRPARASHSRTSSSDASVSDAHNDKARSRSTSRRNLARNNSIAAKRAVSALNSRPTCIMTLLKTLYGLFTASAVIAASIYISAWWNAGYCSHLVIEQNALWSPEYQPLNAQDILALWWPPRCTPCPTHAICERGNVVRCMSSDYLLKAAGLFGQGRKCVPDTEKQANVDKLKDLLTTAIRKHIGRQVCSQRTKWLSARQIKNELLPLVLQTQRSWKTGQRDLYSQLALEDLFKYPPSQLRIASDLSDEDVKDQPTGMFEAYHVEPTMWVTSNDPILPMTCAVQRLTKRLIQQYWQFGIGAFGLFILSLKLISSYRRKAAQKKLITRLTEEVFELLMEQEQSARDHQGEPGFLGVAALGSVFSRRTHFSPTEWRPVWAAVQKNIARDPNVRMITSKHKGEIIEAWEWIGFDALKKHQKKF